MFSETGMGNQISDKLKKDLEDLEREGLSYREMKKLKKFHKETFESNKEKLVSYTVKKSTKKKSGIGLRITTRRCF